MKKLLVIALSAILVLGFATMAMAEITTTGEIDVEYFASTDTTMTELGLYNDITINDNLSGYFGFWMDLNSGDPDEDNGGYGIIDDANFTYKFSDAASVKFGYGKYDYCILDVLGDNRLFDAIYGTYEPKVSILGAFKVAEPVTINVNYFRSQGDDRVDQYGVGARFEQDNIAAQFDYFASSDIGDFKPSAAMFLSGSYKFGEVASVYLVYADAGKKPFNGAFADMELDKALTTTTIGATYTLKKLTFQIEDVVMFDEDLAEAAGFVNSDGDAVKPIGYKINYAVNDNLSIMYRRDCHGRLHTDYTYDENYLGAIFSF